MPATRTAPRQALRPTPRPTPVSLPFIVVFLASTSVMVIELVASRLIAQYVGSNLYTWTSIIAVVLGGLTVGNLVGGAVASRNEGRRVTTTLATVLLASALASLAIVVAVALVFDVDRLRELALPIRVLVGVTAVFFVPATLLGTVAPLAAVWALQGHTRLGVTVGRLYAVGSLGAIVGTLLTGFVLVSLLGSSAIVTGVAVVLAANALLVRPGVATAVAAAVVAVLALVTLWASGRLPLSVEAAAAGQVVYAAESDYQTVAVAVDRHGTRVVVLDNLVHGYVYPDDPTVIVYPYVATYAAAYQAARDRTGRPLASLHLGGGAFTLPRYVAAAYPEDAQVVAEIDPAVTRANQAAAGLEDPPPFELVHVDARELVYQLLAEGRTFDLVFADAFKDYSVPIHLATVEFFQALDGLLDQGGMVLQNVIDDLDQPRMLAALVATVQRVHPHVLVLAPSSTGVIEGRNTFVVASSRSPIDSTAIQRVAAQAGMAVSVLAPVDVFYAFGERQPQVLTDNFAPVEALVSHLYGRP